MKSKSDQRRRAQQSASGPRSQVKGGSTGGPSEIKIVGEEPADGSSIANEGADDYTEEVKRLMEAVAKLMKERASTRVNEIAEVFAQLLDCDDVDLVLKLPPGTTAQLAKEPAFMALVAEARLEESRQKGRDYGAVLSPIERKAARLLAVEGLSKVEVARRLGVDRRTIHNWACHRGFVEYMRYLEEQEIERRNAEYRAAEADALYLVRDVKKVAMRKALELAEQGDDRIIYRVLDRMLK